MKLSASNIGWVSEDDTAVYNCLKEAGFCGLEIAPSRIFPDNPYGDLLSAKDWAEELKETYGFCIPSMQSIWFGKSEMLFGSKEDRSSLLDYTKRAIDFAEAIECKNLVFGCPRNRNVPESVDSSSGTDFFREIGDYAAACGTVIGMEANPPIYNTNYINDTASAIELIETVGSDGFKLNLDVGTMIHNEEDTDILKGKVSLINHVHISEPFLKPIEEGRELHKRLCKLLAEEGYDGFVSIEMGKQDDTGAIIRAIEYIRGIFG